MRLRSYSQNLSRDQRCRVEFFVSHAAVATAVMNREVDSGRLLSEGSMFCRYLFETTMSTKRSRC
jgi:hypothetical protein